MISISATPQFKRLFRKLEPDLQEEALEKMELFSNPANHKTLKVHKLKGKLKNRYSFSVNYKTRIVFIYETKDQITMTAVGDHDVYK